MPTDPAGERDFYSMPMVYDVLHTPGTAEDVRGLARMAERFAGGSTHWLEPACGTGRYLRSAARLGVRAIGFDAEPGMVEYATESFAKITPKPRSFVAQMESFAGAPEAPKPGSIGFAFNPINTIRHLPSDDAMLAHFEQMARVLAPGGVYVVGLSLTIYELEQPSEDVWEGSRGRLHVRQVVNYLPAAHDRFERVVSHLEITRPSGIERVDSTYGLRSYNADEWCSLLDRAGWGVVAMVDEQALPIERLELGYGLFVLEPKR